MAFRSLRSLRSQQGNTLVGIVIGLVIGLVIAVVVALMITKGQSPFTDKGPKNGKPTDEASGQIADPNKPMYGNKEAVKKANSEFEREAAKPPPADELQKVVDTIQAQGNAAAKPAPAPAPATTSPGAPPPVNSAAPPAQAVAPAPALPGEDKFVYYLQAGAFREAADAENTRAKLALLGFEASVSDRTTDAGVLHRVRMGPFTQVEAMNKVRAKLSENGIDVAVVRNQK